MGLSKDIVQRGEYSHQMYFENRNTETFSSPNLTCQCTVTKHNLTCCQLASEAAFLYHYWLIVAFCPLVAVALNFQIGREAGIILHLEKWLSMNISTKTMTANSFESIVAFLGPININYYKIIITDKKMYNHPFY